MSECTCIETGQGLPLVDARCPVHGERPERGASEVERLARDLAQVHLNDGDVLGYIARRLYALSYPPPDDIEFEDVNDSPCSRGGVHDWSTPTVSPYFSAPPATFAPGAFSNAHVSCPGFSSLDPKVAAVLANIDRPVFARPARAETTCTKCGRAFESIRSDMAIIKKASAALSGLHAPPPPELYEELIAKGSWPLAVSREDAAAYWRSREGEKKT